MCQFFKITMPNKETFIIANKRGFAGLARLMDNFDVIPNQEETYIREISLWEFIKYISNNTK